MFLPDFRYHRARELAEALDLLKEHGRDARILAGGTDLMLHMKRGNVWGKPCPKLLVSLGPIEALNGLRQEENDIRIGANVTHREAELSGLVKNDLGALSDAVDQLASVQIRNVATIAGNVCNAAPCADTAAPLMALGAVANVISSKGERSLALEDLFLSPGKVDLGAQEMIKEFRIPMRSSFSASAYERAVRRQAMDITIVGVAVYLRCTPDKEKVQEVRIALNTVAPKPIRAYEAEKMLVNAPVNEAVFEEAGQIAAAHASPRTSFRSTAEYRREMVKVFVKRALQKALERI